MKNVFKRFIEWVLFVLSHKGEVVDNAVDDGLIDHSGQGRNTYGN